MRSRRPAIARKAKPREADISGMLTTPCGRTCVVNKVRGVMRLRLARRQIVSDRALDGCAVHAPHASSQGPAGGCYEDDLTAAVVLARAPVDIAGVRNHIDEPRQVVLLKQHMAFEFEGPQAPCTDLTEP